MKFFKPTRWKILLVIILFHVLWLINELFGVTSPILLSKVQPPCLFGIGSEIEPITVQRVYEGIMHILTKGFTLCGATPSYLLAYSIVKDVLVGPFSYLLSCIIIFSVQLLKKPPKREETLRSISSEPHTETSL